MIKRQFTVETDSLTSTGVCDCCGRTSRRLTGYVHTGDATIAAYIVHWTVGHFPELNANVDLIIGNWGDNTTAADRIAVSLEMAIVDDRPTYMVIDAGSRPVAQSSLVGAALSRPDVIGTPLAAEVFAVIDAISEQDDRLASLTWEHHDGT
jgi:hypothetical protein